MLNMINFLLGYLLLVQVVNSMHLHKSGAPSRPLPKFAVMDVGLRYNGISERNYYDLVQPKTRKGKSPLLVWLHSGAWVTEDIEDSRIMAAKLARDHNVVTALVHYRLSKKGGKNNIQHPIHVQDSLDAFFNVTSLMNKYNIDKSKVFLGGHSAGAHLAGLMALDATSYIGDNGNHLDLIRNIKGVISIGGIFDLDLFSKQDPTYINDFIIPAFGESNWKLASPQYIEKETLDKIKYDKLPKYLLISSDDDPLVKYEQTLYFSKHLDELGFNDVKIVKGNFGQHDLIPSNPKVLDALRNFILN